MAPRLRDRAIALLAAASAPAATVLGETFVPVNGGNDAFIVQAASPGNSYAMPSAGVITSWSYVSGPGSLEPMKLTVLRPLGGTSYRAVGSDGPHPITAPNTLFTFPTRIPVLAGDLPALRFPFAGAFGYTAGIPGYDIRYAFSVDPAPGTDVYLGSFQANSKLDVSAVLEPDCDNDGFGDETQDQDLNSCPPGPSTTITRAPKDRTKKKRATFEFSANETGATFDCVLDGKQEFKACTSPLTVKVKKGKHTFSVTASDAGGNAGAAATDDWKVKKKKKK